MENTITICTYNVGMWTDGTRPGLQPEEIPGRLAAWRAFLADFDPDLLLCEEASPFLDAAASLPAYETLLRERLPYAVRPVSGDGLTAALLLCGKAPIRDVTVRAFRSGSRRPYVTFRTDFGGRELTVGVVHLSIEARAAGIRQRDLAELADTLGRGDLDVVTGDFNTYEIGEFDVFRGRAELANHGAYGDFETWPHDSSVGHWNRCIDNIITRPGLTVRAVRLGKAVLSDHMPLAAQIVI